MESKPASPSTKRSKFRVINGVIDAGPERVVLDGPLECAIAVSADDLAAADTWCGQGPGNVRASSKLSDGPHVGLGCPIPEM
jgi:hypothetical protein